MGSTNASEGEVECVRIAAGKVILEGNLTVPAGARGMVLFAHGSGSSRHSPRNRVVAEALNKAGLGTLLFDLLTDEEQAEDLPQLRFDIRLLAERLGFATDWLTGEESTAELAMGYFGASTGAAAALVAAVERRAQVAAIVSRGGRPDLAGGVLPQVRAPTLLIVGGRDYPVIDMNREAFAQLGTRVKQMVIIPGATHLFEEPGAMEEVTRLASSWLARHLARSVQVPG